MKYKSLSELPPSANPKLRKIMEQAERLRVRLEQALTSAELEEGIRVHSPTDAASILQVFMSNLDREEVWVMLLNTRNEVIGVKQVYRGTVSSAQIRVAEVFMEPTRRNAPNIILAHNHPSGDPAPSPDDVAITRAVVEAGKLLDIDVLDHLILAQGRYVSLKERGLLK